MKSSSFSLRVMRRVSTLSPIRDFFVPIQSAETAFVICRLLLASITTQRKSQHEEKKTYYKHPTLSFFAFASYCLVSDEFHSLVRLTRRRKLQSCTEGTRGESFPRRIAITHKETNYLITGSRIDLYSTRTSYRKIERAQPLEPTSLIEDSSFSHNLSLSNESFSSSLFIRLMNYLEIKLIHNGQKN